MVRRAGGAGARAAVTSRRADGRSTDSAIFRSAVGCPGEPKAEETPVSRFVEVTLDNSTQKMSVRVDSIIKFWQPEGQNYTVLDLIDGKSLTVQETPDDLWNETMD
jgi:hypothetical protein